MSALEPLAEKFGEHDLFLQVLLGLVATANRAGRFLERAATGMTAIDSAGDDRASDTVLMALLGIVSLQRRLEAVLSSARGSEPAESKTPSSVNIRLPSELLR
jgi:hypothetical protein